LDLALNLRLGEKVALIIHLGILNLRDLSVGDLLHLGSWNRLHLHIGHLLDLGVRYLLDWLIWHWMLFNRLSVVWIELLVYIVILWISIYLCFFLVFTLLLFIILSFFTSQLLFLTGIFLNLSSRFGNFGVFSWFEWELVHLFVVIGQYIEC
jgi:hypothetical protein